MEIALRIAIERGADSIVMLGATGGRTDHHLGNLMMLYKMFMDGVEAVIADAHCTVRVSSGNAVIKRDEGKTLSVIPFMGDVTATIDGNVKYPVKDLKLAVASTLGISNEIEDSIIELHTDGYVFIVQS